MDLNLTNLSSYPFYWYMLYLKIPSGYLRKFSDGTANDVIPDQTAPSGMAGFAQA